MLPAKPILLVKIYHEYIRSYRQVGDKSAYEEIRERMTNIFYDYHVLVITHHDEDNEMVKLEAFYPKDFDQFNYDQFKAKIEAELDKISKESQI
jgi:hypothetical protein